jgi:glutamine cyclotransferase
LPHDANAFTEGLLFHDGQLYESTGSPAELANTKSIVGPVDLKTGKIDAKIEIDKSKFFGEGITILNDKLYQLTYKNQICFIYDAKTFKPIGNYKYSNAEGWGMTHDGKSIIMSDGTDKITYWSPADMSVEKTLSVKANGQAQVYLNELEYINGFIYANIWQTTQIAKIDPNTGNIVGVIDIANIFNDAKAKSANIDVPNGIAYNKENDQIYITGKLWKNIYQIQFPH